MSASQHIEWLNLVEKTGPFLAVGVLDDAFPQGLEKVETRKRRRVRSAYEEWRDAVDKPDPDLDALHREWVRLVLEELLEYEPAVLKPADQLPAALAYREPLTGAEVKPDFAMLSGDKARLLVACYAPDTDLSAPLAGQTWAASPVERMIALCRATGVRVGLITDGEQWTVVSVPTEGASSLGTWYARIWQQEPVTLQAFVSLLGVRRCFGPVEGTPETLFARSLEHQNEVTDTLGEQVRRAVEVLVQALDRADLDRDRQLLKDVSPTQLYEAGLTVMMRLVVLLCAEERKLLLLGEPIYDQHYAVSTLRARLREDKERLGDEVLERRHDAWARLLAVFRAVYGGIEHETLRLPPLGGSLLDPDRFPFLEGRAAGTSWRDTPAAPLPIDNRTVLMLLTALQVLEQRTGALLLSYEALDVEQIGHVYEGLLERTVARVPETTLGLVGSQKAINPNVPLRELEETKAQGDDRLLAFLLEKTGRSESGLRNALAKKVEEALYHRVLLACGGDIPLTDHLKPWAHLLRTDSWGEPLAYRKDSFIVTLGAGRRETGTHYTPKSLTEPIVQHTLEPLVYVGPAEGKPQPEWRLKSPREILALKVCDMTMGSAAFLVQTCRWLADRLVETWDAAEKSGHQVSIEGEVLDKAAPSNAPSPTGVGESVRRTDEGSPGENQLSEAGKSPSPPAGAGQEGLGEVGQRDSALPTPRSAIEVAPELMPRDKAERVLIARRLIASRCLYGVDINPMAVELAKVSLWLVTMMKGRPLSFLDHALKCGDSLLGVSSVQQIENFSLRPGERQVTFATANLFRYVDEASAKRRALEALPSNDHTQIQTKNRLHAEAEAATAKVKGVADCLIAFELRSLDGKAYEEQRTDEAERVQLLMNRDADISLNSPTPSINQLSTYAREQLRGSRSFHWAVEFPEVFARGGFDVFIGNPPFKRGKDITGLLGQSYREYIVRITARNARGSADLVVYFFLRAFDLMRNGGCFGLLGTNTITEGDSREVGLDRLLLDGAVIFNAVPDFEWPGDASLLVSEVHIRKGVWRGNRMLAGSSVPTITGLLNDECRGTPHKLSTNESGSYQGTNILGLGFTIAPDKAAELIKSEKAKNHVLMPYLGGKDVTDAYDQQASRWVVNFWDWPLDRSKQGSWSAATDKQRDSWIRSTSVPPDYPYETASDYPELLGIVLREVKGERAEKNRKQYRELWWQFGEKQKALYHAIGRGEHFTASEFARCQPAEKVLVQVMIAKYLAPVVVSNKGVFSHRLVVFTTEPFYTLAVTQSSLHEAWVLEFGGTLETRMSYTPSDSFETFPQPDSHIGLQEIGLRYSQERTSLMASTRLGLTDTYNRFHDRGEQSEDIARLRALHVEMDQTVAAAYGWSDLDLGHDFHETKQGVRYTLSEPARRTVLDRLLALNHQRYAEEVAAGLHDKGAKKGKGRKTIPTQPQRDLFS